MRKKIENEIVSCDCCGGYINETPMFTMGYGSQSSIKYKDLDICCNCQKTVLEGILNTYEEYIDIKYILTKCAPQSRSFGTIIPCGGFGDLGVALNKDNNEK